MPHGFWVCSVWGGSPEPPRREGDAKKILKRAAKAAAVAFRAWRVWRPPHMKIHHYVALGADRRSGQTTRSICLLPDLYNFCGL
jgi:hypothetical protein